MLFLSFRKFRFLYEDIPEFSVFAVLCTGLLKNLSPENHFRLQQRVFSSTVEFCNLITLKSHEPPTQFVTFQYWTFFYSTFSNKNFSLYFYLSREKLKSKRHEVFFCANYLLTTFSILIILNQNYLFLENQGLPTFFYATITLLFLMKTSLFIFRRTSKTMSNQD